MALRVAPCPKCNSALVFGERACRRCGQTFQYAEPGPPVPTPEQMIEAFVAAGLMPAPEAPRSPAAAAPAAPPADAAVGTLEGLDTGRFRDAGQVAIEDVPGFMISTVFAPYTPAHVSVDAVFGLELGRFDEVGAVAPAFTPGLEVTPLDEVGEVFVQPVNGLFRSDIYRTPDDAPTTARIDGFEPTTSAPRPKSPGPKAAPAQATSSKSSAELDKVLCRCGEVHRLPRCPACGTPRA